MASGVGGGGDQAERWRCAGGGRSERLEGARAVTAGERVLVTRILHRKNRGVKLNGTVLLMRAFRWP
jgi:hypothetical protein